MKRFRKWLLAAAVSVALLLSLAAPVAAGGGSKVPPHGSGQGICIDIDDAGVCGP
jgi:hypothetical protein